jgi:putrescine aminotransferase
MSRPNEPRQTEARQTEARHARHINPAFIDLLGVFGYGRVYTRGEGCTLEDDQGRRYLDALSGFGALPLGHNHPALNARMAAFFTEGRVNLSHIGPAPEAAALAEALSRLTGDQLSVSLFANGGAEGVEAALKLARLVTGRQSFLHCAGGYHGTSLATLSILGEARMRAPFGPLLPSAAVPFGDAPALKAALAGKAHAAFIVEPIQAEAGVILPPHGYLAEAAALCRAAGTLFVLDEIQTGIGRTGALLASTAEGVTPDLLVLGKGLSGGVSPISVALVRADLHKRAYGTMDRFDLHSSTFGGNALAAEAARETLRILEADHLCAAADRVGRLLLSRLSRGLADHPFVLEVRGRGLLIGVALGPKPGAGLLGRLAPGLVSRLSRQVFGQWLALELLEAGFIAQPCALSWNVLKLEPPLTLPEAEALRLADAVIGILDRYRSVPALLQAVTRRLGEQAWRGGEFR